MSDFARAKALIIVFAMPGCPACEDYLPRFERAVNAARLKGSPFQFYEPSTPLYAQAIPILIIDATSQDPGIQQYADANGINAMPTTLFFVRGRTAGRTEGALSNQDITKLLDDAVRANR